MADAGAPLRQALHHHCLRDIPVAVCKARASLTSTALLLLSLAGGDHVELPVNISAFQGRLIGNEIPSYPSNVILRFGISASIQQGLHRRWGLAVLWRLCGGVPIHLCPVHLDQHPPIGNGPHHSDDASFRNLLGFQAVQVGRAAAGLGQNRP